MPPNQPILSQSEREEKRQQALLLARYLRQSEENQAYEESLKAFMKGAWPIIGMGTPFSENWHLDCLAEHMEALLNRDISKLIINISPRSLKSTTLSVCATAWWWIKHPEEKFLSSSYIMKLSMRDSRYTRNLIRSKWYQDRWGDRFRITSDQNEKARFENDKGGYRIATAQDSGTMGDGANVRIYDDQNDLNDIDSKVSRQAAIDFYGVMSTRMVDPKTDVELCVQQRGHSEDLTGYLLGLGGWEHVSIPMEFEGNSKPSSIGWRDPRTHQGELMHPSRFGPMELDILKKTLGPKYAGQFQQRPAAEIGNLLKREDWKFWNPSTDANTSEQFRLQMAQPIVLKIGGETIQRFAEEIPAAFEQVVQSWDMAFKDMEQNDFVCGQAWGRLGANAYLLAQDYEHKDFPQTCNAVRIMSNNFPCPEKLVEDKANGPAVIQTLKNEIPGLTPVKDDGGKVARVSAISGYVHAGNAWLPNPNLYPWVWDLIDETADFPSTAHDDRTDSLSQALRHLFNSMAHNGLPEFRVQPRVGEPSTACHVEANALRGLQPHWRRWIALAPGHPGAAIWLCETPSGALRVYRELSLAGADAQQAGKMIADTSLPDIEAYLSSIHQTARWNLSILMEKSAFAAIEPVGSFAALLEDGILSWEPTKDPWEIREKRKFSMLAVKFGCEMANLEDATFDRIRALLQFQPLNFKEEKYDRSKAVELAKLPDIAAYKSYMEAVEGRVAEDLPRLKIDASCRNLIASLGCVRRDEGIDSADPFVRALLIGVSQAPDVAQLRGPREVPYESPAKRQQRELSLRRRAGRR